MAAHSYDDLVSHQDHELEIVTYGTVNAAIECVDCNEVLLDFDREPECGHNDQALNPDRTVRCLDCGQTLGERTSVDDCPTNFHAHNSPADK